MLRRSLFFMERLTGKVTSWGSRRWGLIQGQENVTYLCLYSAITASIKSVKLLKVGETVEFDSADYNGRKRAINVTAPGGGPVEGADYDFAQTEENKEAQGVSLRGRLTGTVKFRSGGKSPFGTIVGQNNCQLFWHHSSISASVKPFKTLNVGETVEFEIIERNGRQEAGKLTAPGGGPVEGADKLIRNKKKNPKSIIADPGAQGVASVKGRLTGKVTYRAGGSKPFGFITDQNNVEYYWNINTVKASVKPLKVLNVGETVEFDCVEIDGKRSAENVTTPGGGPVQGFDENIKIKEEGQRKRPSTKAVQGVQGRPKKNARNALPGQQQLAVSRPRSALPSYTDALLGVA